MPFEDELKQKIENLKNIGDKLLVPSIYLSAAKKNGKRAIEFANNCALPDALLNFEWASVYIHVYLNKSLSELPYEEVKIEEVNKAAGEVTKVIRDEMVRTLKNECQCKGI